MEDHARFWWQYAAGAGDETASYCLHLHHLSLGEAAIAALWNRPNDVASQEGTFPQRIDMEWNIPTMLRLLTMLTAGGRHRDVDRITRGHAEPGRIPRPA